MLPFNFVEKFLRISLFPVREDGFTLLELMVVIAIIAALSGFALPSFSNYIENQNIKQSQDQIRSDIRAIQLRAVNGVTDTSLANPATYWGIVFGQNQGQYVFVVTDGAPSTLPGICTSAINPANWGNYERSTPLPGDVLVQDNACFFFSLESGDADCEYSAEVGVDYAGGTGSNGVGINKLGTVYIFEGSNPIPVAERCD